MRTSRWDGLGVASLARQWGVPEVHAYARVGSTNDLARSLAESGCPDGTCVIADEQIAGRGRAERRWTSPAGLGVWMSLVLRPRGLRDPGVLPLVVGVAVARALDPFARPAVPQVKWPNDVLLANRKVGGILCEGSWDGDSLRFVVIGIGLNVLHSPEDFPVEIRDLATSLRIVSGWAPPREEIACAVARAVVEAMREPVLDTSRLEELARRDSLCGHEVTVTEPLRAEVRGIATGIAPDGSLLLRTPSGVLRRIRNGTVRRVAPGGV